MDICADIQGSDRRDMDFTIPTANGDTPLHDGDLASQGVVNGTVVRVLPSAHLMAYYEKAEAGLLDYKVISYQTC